MIVNSLGTSAPDNYAVVELDEMPGMAASRRGALRQAVPLPGRSRPLQPPRIVLEAPPVSPSASEIAAFAHMVGAGAGDRLPASYLHVAGFPLALALLVSPVFPMPALGMVHITNRVRQSRPVRFGEEVTFRTWAANMRAHRRGALIDVHMSATVEGEAVWHGVSGYLARGVEAPGEPEDSRPTWERDGLDAEGLHSWSLPADTGRRYAEVSGDSNPIHTSRIGARLFGFPRPIAHGMYTASRALAEIGEPAAGAVEWSVAFGKPVILPARVDLEFSRTDGTAEYAVVRRKPGEDARVHLTGAVTTVA